MNMILLIISHAGVVTIFRLLQDQALLIVALARQAVALVGELDMWPASSKTV